MGKERIMKDALALFLITLVAGVALGFVYELTKEPIRASKAKAKQEAYLQVFPEAARFEEDASLENLKKKSEDILAKAGYESVTVTEALVAYDAMGEDLGLVLMVTTKEGYAGDITITLGINHTGMIKGVEFLSISETAGLGMKAKEEPFKGQYRNKSVPAFEVVKTGSASDEQIDAITGATITSRAVTGAVNAGLAFAKEYEGGRAQ